MKKPLPDDTSTDALELSVRTLNVLHNANIHTIGDLKAAPLEEMAQWRNFGVKSFAELLSKMSQSGLLDCSVEEAYKRSGFMVNQPSSPLVRIRYRYLAGAFIKLINALKAEGYSIEEISRMAGYKHTILHVVKEGIIVGE